MKRETFVYVGRANVRSWGRGLSLLDPPQGTPDGLTEFDLAPGMYRVELRCVPVDEPDPYDPDFKPTA